MTIQLSGFRELEAAMRRLPEVVQRDYMNDAVEQGAQVILADAVLRAPVEFGDLVESLMLRITRQRNTGGDPRAEVGPSKEEQHVGRFQEFGTAHHAAHPFLRPALESRGAEAIRIVGDVLRDRLERGVAGR
jgi:HK97 gp10 family phage protein